MLVVDDSFFMRKLIKEILEDIREIEIVGEAKDGAEALALVFALEPDVVTMDYNMPEMDGEQATMKILHGNPNPPAIIMLSANTKEGSDTTFRCLRAGAIDFVTKPSGEVSLDLEKIKNELVEKIKVAAMSHIQSRIEDLEKIAHDLEISGHSQKKKETVKAVVIGSSTGGPPLIEDILLNLPGDLNIPIFVVQHMPEEFTHSFAERLDKFSALRVREATDGDIVTPGSCYLAKGGWHMEVKTKRGGNEPLITIHLTKDEKHNGYRPSIDVTMQSVAKIYQENTLGIVLTGMGEDGAAGMKYVKKENGQTIVQSPQQAVIDSMPLAVIQVGAADQVMEVKEIIKKIIELTKVKK